MLIQLLQLPLIPVGGNYIILVHALSNEKARALATLLKSFVQFGNVSVTVIVTNNENEIVNPFPCPLDAFEIAHLFQVALENNPYFEQVVVQPQFPGTECCFSGFRCGSHSVFQ